MGRKKLEDLTEKERKEKYLKELKEMFSVLDENKRRIIYPHLDRIAYLKVKLESLEDIIDEQGLIDKYQNGENQWGYKPSAAVKTYNDLNKSFISETKFVEPYLPASTKVSKLSML